MIALLGGTFDPVHVGHLAAARAARILLGVDSVRLVVAAMPYHKSAGTGSASEQHRFAMLSLACQADSGLIADGSELGRLGPSYTVDLLERRARACAGEWRCWIIGSDAFAQILGWHRYTDVFSLTNFLVFRRPPSPLTFTPALQEFIVPRIVEALESHRHGQVRLVEAALPEVSSSQVRERLRAGEPVRDLVPPAVIEYIREHHLYEKTAQIQAR